MGNVCDKRPDRGSFVALKEKGRAFVQPDSLDQHFTYNVGRSVVVKDARLGISYYVMTFGMFLFILFYQMGYSGGHIAFEAPFGTVSYQFKRPTTSATPLNGANSYFNLSDTDRTNAATLLPPVSSLPYCLNETKENTFCSTDPNNSTYYCKPMSCAKAKVTLVYNNQTSQFENVTTYSTSGACSNAILPKQIRLCKYLDEEFLFPGQYVFQTMALVTTRVSWAYQKQLCEYPPDDNTPCTYLYTPYSSNKYHTVAPEEFEIMFDHQAFASNGISATQEAAFDAPLVFKDGTTYYPAYINPSGNNGTGSFYRPDDKLWIPGYYAILGRHVMSVGTLLAAAGVDSLDKTTQGLFDAGSTLRYTGVTVSLQITYSNYNPMGYVTTDPVTYTYSAVSGTTYAAYHQVTWDGELTTNNTRLFENRHGVRIFITQSGVMGAATLVDLMIFFGTSTAVLGIASTLVDIFIIRRVMAKKTKQILELAESAPVPPRSVLNRYIKGVEKHYGGEYKAPENYWQMEQELQEQAEAEGRIKPRPSFKKHGVQELEAKLEAKRLEREKGSHADQKDDDELRLVGAVAFARGISEQPPVNPEMVRQMSSQGREHWRLAKEGVYAQVRAKKGVTLPRVQSALAGRRVQSGEFKGEGGK